MAFECAHHIHSNHSFKNHRENPHSNNSNIQPKKIHRYKQAETRVEIMHEPRCEKQTSDEARERLKFIPECELRHVHFEKIEQKQRNTNIELRKDRFRETAASSWKGPIQGLSGRDSETWDGPIEGIIFMEEEHWEYVHIYIYSSVHFIFA